MTETAQVKAERLPVPGATLYYEVRGSGPVLVMMPGGPADAAVFSSIAGTLASDYTVVTYDPRGLSHSPLEGPLDDNRIVEVFADDVHRILSAVAEDRAFVFGNSGGATIALELATRHPEQLRTVVAHEPPSAVLLPDPEAKRAAMEDVTETYRTAGLWPAMQKFMVLVGIEGGPLPAPGGEPTPEMLERMAQMQRNLEFFAGRYIPAIARYQPDFAALKAGGCRIVAAVGDESRGQLAHEGGLGLAKGLGIEATAFPGDHGGFDKRAPEFANRLREVLSSSGT